MGFWECWIYTVEECEDESMSPAKIQNRPYAWLLHLLDLTQASFPRNLSKIFTTLLLFLDLRSKEYFLF